jgi:hypothetical protein
MTVAALATHPRRSMLSSRPGGRLGDSSRMASPFEVRASNPAARVPVLKTPLALMVQGLNKRHGKVITDDQVGWEDLEWSRYLPVRLEKTVPGIFGYSGSILDKGEGHLSVFSRVGQGLSPRAVASDTWHFQRALHHMDCEGVSPSAAREICKKRLRFASVAMLAVLSCRNGGASMVPVVSPRGTFTATVRSNVEGDRG